MAMHRLYNPNSGEHFYTADEAERNAVVKAGWTYEGIGWYAPESSDTPVMRLYNSNAGDHHFTTDQQEAANLIRLGWHDEGIGWYSDDEKRVPVYRQYNPNAIAGAHNFTTDKQENDNLKRLGWREEGIAWYGVREGKTPPALAAPSTSGALHVRGTNLVDANGNTVQLKGISTHGLAWFPGYVNNACFSQLRRDWGANLVRLAMYTNEYGGYCSGGDKEALKKLVLDGVKYAHDNNLYVIVDWHILSDGNPLTNLSEAKAFFNEMTKSLKQYDNVLYEICNEPNGNVTWVDVKSYAQQVIPVIRKNDPDAVVLVGSPTWSQDIDKAAADPLAFDNVMYTLHFYAGTHKDDLRNRLTHCIRAGLPVFVSEFGICNASGNGAIDEASANAWLSTLNSHQVSWCMWSLCNKAESASAIKSSCNKTSGFTQDDLSQSGRWLVKALKGAGLPQVAEEGDDTVGGSQQPSNPGGQPTFDVGKTYAFTSGNLSCSASLTNAWADGSSYCYQYSLTITNDGVDCSSWSIEVPFSQDIALSQGWCGSFEAIGSRLVISNASYNGSLAKGESRSDVGFIVSSTSPSLAIAGA